MPSLRPPPASANIIRMPAMSSTTTTKTTQTSSTSSSLSWSAGRQRLSSSVYGMLLWTVLLLVLMRPDTGAVVQALQITLTVPAFVETGQNVTLTCDHDADAAELYTLKWYRLSRTQKTQKPDASTRGREFVRYTPKEIPSMKYFAQNGLTVDMEQTTGRHVLLQNVNQRTVGKFACEVSLDSPTFQTETAYAELEVVVSPPSDPSITGLKPYYALGETLQANCTLNGSIPAAHLDWKMNNIPVNADAVMKYEAVKDTVTKLMVRTIGLHIGRLGHEHFVKGKLTITCSGHIHKIYRGVKEVVVEEDRPQVFSPSLSYLSDDVHVTRNTTATGQGMGISVGVRYLDQTSQNVINDNTQAASARNWSSPRTTPANWLQLLSLAAVACCCATLAATATTTTTAASASDDRPNCSSIAGCATGALRLPHCSHSSRSSTTLVTTVRPWRRPESAPASLRVVADAALNHAL